MNRLILRYAVPITTVILAVFAWVVFQRISRGDVVPLAATALVVWAIGAPAFIVLWPRLTVGGFRRAILHRGLGGGPIPVNTLYAEPRTASPATASGSLLDTGTDDLLYVAGWLDLRRGPQVLHVPDAGGRYYSVQLTDPATGANFAYVGTRVTGDAAGHHVLAARGWAGTVPAGTRRIEAPHRSALLIGRVFVAAPEDRAAAYAFARGIRLTPLAP